MRLEFTKMHGLGNDFMVIDLVSQRVRLTPELIRQLADRHFGVGFDQLLVVEPPVPEPPWPVVAVVVEHEDATRESPGLADYVDLVQVASLLTYRGTDHPWASLPWASVPATLAVGLEENEVESLLGYAGARVGELRRLLGPQSAASVAGSPVRRQAAG